MSYLRFQIEPFRWDTLYAWWLRQTWTYMTKRRLCQINVSIMVIATILYFLEYLKYRIVAHTKPKEPFILAPTYSRTTVCQNASAIEIHIFSQSKKNFYNLNLKAVLLLDERLLKMLKFLLNWLSNRMAYESSILLQTRCTQLNFWANASTTIPSPKDRREGWTDAAIMLCQLNKSL